MKWREKLSLAAFLLIALSLAHAINSPSAPVPLEVSISESNENACPRSATGYDPNFCHANYFQLPDVVVAKTATRP